MDRMIVRPGAIPLETDVLYAGRFAMVAVAAVTETLVGRGTVLTGLGVAPTVPASLSVTAAPGSISTLSTVDGTAYSSLPVGAQPLVKTGINLDATPLTFVAPGTSGQSQVFLIQGQLVEADGTSVVLPYYNAANPAQAFAGPGNSGTSQPTQRTQRVGIQVKTGVAASTGSQVAPAADAGWVPIATVTLANGQTTITSGSIAVHPSAPYAPATLPQVGAQVATLVAAAGLTYDPTNSGQALSAANVLYSPGRLLRVSVLTASTTFTPLAATKSFRIIVVGGGGGGANCIASAFSGASNTSGGGGGAGGISCGLLAIGAITATVTVTVGAGGAAQANGTASSFGSYLSAAGGNGAGFSSTGVSAGGIGGTATGGSLFNVRGGYGGDGQSASMMSFGNGAPGPWGGAGRAGAQGGMNASGFGAAGGGAYDSSLSSTTYYGGTGYGGVVIIEEYA